MSLRAILAAAALFLALPEAASAKSTAAARMEYIDLTSRFEEIWQAVSLLPEAERAAAFRARFAPILPGFYDVGRFKDTPPERYDAHILRGLIAYPQQRAAIQAVSREFEAMFRSAGPSFEARFGPMDGFPPVYLLHSLGEFDGATRMVAGRSTLLFGADLIARYHASNDLQPLFHHELFHMRQGRSWPDCGKVWCAVWSEGLAVYAAASLNPKATHADLLLMLPEPIPPEVDKDRRAAVCAVIARLESEDSETYSALFSSKRLGPGLPPRFGYYVGYLAAAEIGKSHDLVELADMQPRAVRPLLERGLRTVAGGPC